MACITSDGALTEAARALLAALAEPLTPEEIAARVGQPLYRVRSSLREMAQAGLVENTGDAYRVTAAGRERIVMPV
jgi:predicted transcriptional regulator